MAINPAEFDNDPYAPWPNKGAQVVCRKDGRTFVGEVALVWIAMDAVCINVQTLHGLVHIFREHGDTCEVVT